MASKELVTPKVQLGGVTTRVTAKVCTSPPPLAVNVPLYVPGATLAATVNVVTMVPSPGEAKEDLVRVAVIPVGSPDQTRLIAELNKPLRALLALNGPVPPVGIETLAGAAVNVKLDGVTVTATGTVAVKLPLVAVSESVNVLAAMLMGVVN